MILFLASAVVLLAGAALVLMSLLIRAVVADDPYLRSLRVVGGSMFVAGSLAFGVTWLVAEQVV